MSEEKQEPTREELLEAYDAALLVQKDFDNDRGELMGVALSVYVGHASSADGPVTMQSALKKAQELINKVNSKLGERPSVPSYPSTGY